MSFCLDTYLQQSDDYEILIARSGFKDCAKLIKEVAPEIFNVKPGDFVLGVRIIGIPPIPIGINPEKGTILIPYTKPCHGTSVIELPMGSEELDKIKE